MIETNDRNPKMDPTNLGAKNKFGHSFNTEPTIML